VGVESTHPASLEDLGKRQNLRRDPIQAVRRIQSYGISVMAHWIIGSDSDDLSAFQRLRDFLREARILASLSHPHIVQVYDMGQVSGRQYLVMEYLDGSSLADVLDRVPQHRLPLGRVAVMARELAEALDFAHQHRVIHRDIKPGNVMVLQDGRCKLMDFGMAKALEVHRDRSLFICGTPDYMSPEQEAGHDLTPATDLYSFGLLLMEMLLGPIPSGPTARNARDARLQVLDQSALPRPLREVIRRCLDLDPGARPATSREVAEVLQQCASAPEGDFGTDAPPPIQR